MVTDRMVKVTIIPRHDRLQKYLAGRGVINTQEKQTLEIEAEELRGLLRKAKEFGFEDDIKVEGRFKRNVETDLAAKLARPPGARKASSDEEPDVETTADANLTKETDSTEKPPEEDEEPEVEEPETKEAGPKRRRVQ